MSKGKSFLGFGPPCAIELTFTDAASRRKIDSLVDDKKSSIFVFHKDDAVAGEVRVVPHPGKKIEHLGIRIEFIGEIIVISEATETFQFSSLVSTVADRGVIGEVTTFSFDFACAEKPNESYNGINARLRYFVRFVISRSFSSDIVREEEFWVEHIHHPPEINTGVKMEVGVENLLHIEFEFDKSKYHTRDVILGKVYFVLVRARIKSGEVSLIRRETTGTGANLFHENETIARFEVMDGMPAKGESVPVRFFLTPYSLSPTYRNVNNKFSVRYFLNLILVGEDDRRFFKQQEITLWRKS